MKKLFLISIPCLILFFGVSSCKKSTPKVRKTITVEVPITKTKTMADSIPSIPIAVPFPGLGILKDTFATKVDEMLSTYAVGVKKEDIISIKPTYFQAVIDNSNSQNFDFIDDSVFVDIDKYQGNTPINVAYLRGLPKGSKTLNFSIVNANIKDLFFNEFLEFNLRFGTPANSSMKANSVFITSIKFEITAYEPE